MSKKRNNRNGGKRAGIWGLMLIGAFVLGASATYVQLGPNARIPAEERRSERLPQHQEAGKQASRPAQTSERQLKDEVEIIRPRGAEDQVVFERERRRLPENQEAIPFAVNEFLKQSKIAPDDASLVGYKLNNGELVLSFNRAFDRTYGSEDERVLVEGILRSVGQFEDVRSVRFTIEWEPMETLGHLDLTIAQAPLRD